MFIIVASVVLFNVDQENNDEVGFCTDVDLLKIGYAQEVDMRCAVMLISCVGTA